MTDRIRQRPCVYGVLMRWLLLMALASVTIVGYGRAERAVELTPDERAYLNRKGTITYCLHPDRLPFSAIREGRPAGMAVDVIDRIGKQLDIPFRFVPTKSWQMSLEYAESGGCDILPVVDIPSSRPDYLRYTPSFFHYTPAIITRTHAPFITGIQDLQDRSIGIGESDPILTPVIEHYPRIPITIVSTPRDGLMKVSSGSLDALIIAPPVAVYHIRRFGLTDLKIAGHVDLPREVGIAVRAEMLPLQPILGKTVASLTRAEVNRIYRKQITVRPHRQIDYRTLILVLLVMAVVVGSAIFWHRKVGRLRKRIATARAELAAKDEQINRMAITDPLTCLNNRMRLIDILGKETQRFRRYGHPTSIIFSDVDHFKDINETFGYNLGDVVLCKMGETLAGSIRKADICGRWGGEKFMVICPETEIEGARTLAEHLRKRIEALSLPKVGPRTCSFGIASFLPGDTEESIVQRADRSQNLAKEKGGNRVETVE